MHEAIGSLHNGRNGEGRGAASRGVNGQEDVLRVLRGVARAVVDGRRHARHHVLDVAGGEGLLGAVGGNAKALTEEHGRVLCTGAQWALRSEGGVGAQRRSSPARSFLTVSTFAELSHRGMLASL